MNRKRIEPGPAFHPELVRTTREFNDMLMHEALARARMREAERAAQRERFARRVSAARSWRRVAAWAARRAAKADAAL